MRPYLVLCAVVLMAAVAFGQTPASRASGSCVYGCVGPYIPLITTPEISLQTYSPNPVGATNATTGLTAGATNSTLSEITGNTSSSSTVAVWYQGGGAPLTDSDVHLYPQPLGHAAHAMHEMREMHEEREARHENAGWIYYSGSEEHTSNAVAASRTAKGAKKASHVYTNEDVERQNKNNGTVKLNGKPEKL